MYIFISVITRIILLIISNIKKENKENNINIVINIIIKNRDKIILTIINKLL